MKRHSAVLGAVLALSLASAPAFAHDHAAAAAPAGTGLRALVQASLDDAEKKLTALAEAMPAEKYAWRPGEKVRSAGEVFMHVAGGNYYLTGLLGAKAPEGVDARSFDKDANDKAKTMATLKASFDHTRKFLAAMTDADLAKSMKVFDHEGTASEMVMILATHAHEHLGQSIAYARSNGVVPPWSQ